MEWGSSYIYDYQGESEDEELSVGELEEGMYLSDSDDEEAPPLPPPPAMKRSGTARPPKSLPTPDDGSSSDEEEDDDEDEMEPQITRQSGYVDLSFIPTSNEVNKKNEEEEEGSPVKYAQLKEFQQQIRNQEPDEPNPTPKTQSASATVPLVATESTPSVTPHSYSVPAPPPPPIKQLHGIMKGELRKQKKQRVRWNKSYRKQNEDSSQNIKTRKADTNILVVKFNTLREAGHIHTGDAQFCSNTECGAVVSHLTKLIGDDDDDKKTWNCEFCGTVTELDIVREEIPTEEDTTYLITPAAVMATEGGGTVGMDESLVVFCIDTSGSMCVTTKVPGTYDIRGAKEKREKAIKNLPADIAAELQLPEYRFVQRRQQNVTWISRMESLQAAIDTQLSRLVHSEPSKRVSIVTFSDDVTIMGDGRMVPVTIAGEKLSDSKSIIDVGRDVPLPAPIRETQKALSKKIFSLEESGQTALGPAALASVVIASQKPGSRVVLCTDGLANVGLGSLDIAATARAAYAQAENFYEDLGDIAMDKGVTVSLLSIKGSDCRVVELGQVSTRTGGQVTIVDPLTVTEEFGSILSNPILATDVVTKIIVHREMYFRNEDSKENIIVKQVGNVTADSELTFEYGIRKTAAEDVKTTSDGGDDVTPKAQASGGASINSSAVPPQMVNGQTHLPFQLQIEYTNSDGDRCLRVITQTKPVTKDRLVAEKEMDAGIIGTHVAKQAAELTMQGEFTQARVKSLATQRMLQKHSHSSASRRWEYTNWCSNMIPLDNELQRMQVTERSEGRDLSDEEYEEERFERGSELLSTSYAAPKHRSKTTPMFSSSSAQSAPAPARKSKMALRRRDISDDLAYGVYGLKKASSSAFTSPRSPSENVTIRKPHSTVPVISPRSHSERFIQPRSTPLATSSQPVVPTVSLVKSEEKEKVEDDKKEESVQDEVVENNDELLDKADELF